VEGVITDGIPPNLFSWSESKVRMARRVFAAKKRKGVVAKAFVWRITERGKGAAHQVKIEVVKYPKGGRDGYQVFFNVFPYLSLEEVKKLCEALLSLTSLGLESFLKKAREIPNLEVEEWSALTVRS